MNGREGWAKFAEENGLTWEEGPPKPRDQHGNEYLTVIWDKEDFGEQVLRILRKDKHVIVRVFPHDAEFNKGHLVRMRFTSYPSKPE
jgi:hypothetical protein